MTSPTKVFLRNYYAYGFLWDFIFAYAIYGAMFEMRGLSVLEISTLLAFWSAATIALEIPSGALSDHWDRRAMLILAPFLKALCFITWFLAAGDFWLYGLGFLFWTTGSCLVSGTKEALLFDVLEKNELLALHEEILGREKLLYYISLSVAGVLGGFIAYYSIDLALLLSAATILIAAIPGFFLRDVRHRASAKPESYFAHFGNTWRELRVNPALRFLIGYSVLLMTMGAVEEFDQLYYRLVELPIWAFGLVGASGSALAGGSSYFAHHLKRVNLPWDIVLPAFTGICLLIVGLFPSVTSLAFLILAYFFMAPLTILLQAKIQASIQSESRATITSAVAFFDEIGGIPQMLAFGFAANTWGLGMGYSLFGAAVLLALFWVTWQRREGLTVV